MYVQIRYIHKTILLYFIVYIILFSAVFDKRPRLCYISGTDIADM